MPTLKSHLKRPEEKIRRGKLTQNLSLSFHGQSLVSLTAELHWPKTLPELLSNKDVVVDTNLQEGRPRLMKLLLNVTIQGSLGQLQVVMTPESTVNDLIATSVRIYAKEDLHYSQFSLESLHREEKVIALGSRNYFLCVKKAMVVDICTMTPSSSCSKQVEKASKNWFVWLKFMDFLQL